MKAMRSVVNMAAVKDPSPRKPRAMSSARVKEVLMLTTLTMTVTAGGVAIGVYGVSPLLGKSSWESVKESLTRFAMQSIETVGHALQQPRVVLTLAITAFVAAALLIGTAISRRGGSRKRASSHAAPAMVFNARTPRDVQVMAAAGKAPADIAARTRLPVDAVSMLLNIGQTTA